MSRSDQLQTGVHAEAQSRRKYAGPCVKESVAALAAVGCLLARAHHGNFREGPGVYSPMAGTVFALLPFGR